MQPINKIRLYQPHLKQKAIHEACLSSDKSFFVIVVAGRRGGKTLCAINQVLYWALKDVGCNIWYVCPTDTQCENVLNEISKTVRDSLITKKINNSKGDRVIEFNNGSHIYFKSAMASDSLRGSKVNYLVTDEAAFINDNIFDSVLMPSMAVDGRKCLIISTPKGRNWFYKYYQKGLEKVGKGQTKKYKSFKFTSLDNPHVDKSLVELFKASVPEAIYQQEYEGQFVDSASVFKFVDEICCLELSEDNIAPIKGEKYLCGIDIGMLIDDTVITILDTKGTMKFQDSFTNLEAPELRERILKTLNKYKPIYTLIEENNQGLPLIQDLKRVYNGNLEGFHTSNKSKEEIINKLVAAFSAKEIKCLRLDDLINQLNAFIFELTSTRKIRYCAAQGFHDDKVISLAIAFSLVDSFKNRIMLKDNYVTGMDKVGNQLIDSKGKDKRLLPPPNTAFRY